MNVKQFAEELASHAKEVDHLMKRKLPVMVGRMAKDHFQDNFRQGGFVNGGIHQWPITKRQKSGAKSAAANYGPLLSKRNHLFSSIKYVPSDYRVVVSNTRLYAPIHNWGGMVRPNVTPKMRKFAWYMYYKAQGKRRGKTTPTGKKKKTKTTKPESQEAKFWKGMALTKKKRLNIMIPQRQFLGESEELNDKIERKIEDEITKIIN